VVDRAIVGAKVAAIRDATDRIGRVLPPEAGAFEADRTTREVVVLNLFVAGGLLDFCEVVSRQVAGG
jgi:hypothetical protein